MIFDQPWFSAKIFLAALIQPARTLQTTAARQYALHSCSVTKQQHCKPETKSNRKKFAQSQGF
jgi:hypothetical protein